jgi:hypothetical protein
VFIRKIRGSNVQRLDIRAGRASTFLGSFFISVLLRKPRPFKEQQRSMTDGIFLTTNRTNFYEWGAASPENFIVGLIRVYSKNSWFKTQRTTRF